MPVRLLNPYNGQTINTTYSGPDEAQLRTSGNADDRLDLASDFSANTRNVTAATTNVGVFATTYLMNSATAQTLNLGQTGYFPLQTVLTILPVGTGATTVVPATGVTINTAASSLVTKTQYAPCQLVKVTPTSWIAYGAFGG